MKSIVLAIVVSLAAVADRPTLASCCLGTVGFAIPFTAPAAAKPQQAQEHHPGTCNNFRSNANPCACHNATTCPERGEDGKEIPRGEDQKCQQYCDKEDCKCINPCDT